MDDNLMEMVSKGVAVMISRSREHAGVPIPAELGRRIDPAHLGGELTVDVGVFLEVPEMPKVTLTHVKARRFNLAVIKVGERRFRSAILKTPSFYWYSENFRKIPLNGGADDFDVRKLPEACWAGVSGGGDNPYDPGFEAFRHAPLLYAAVVAGHL